MGQKLSPRGSWGYAVPILQYSPDGLTPNSLPLIIIIIITADAPYPVSCLDVYLIRFFSRKYLTTMTLLTLLRNVFATFTTLL